VVVLDGVEQPVNKGSLVHWFTGSLVHIPTGAMHGAHGKMRDLVVGIPDIAEDGYFEAAAEMPTT